MKIAGVDEAGRGPLVGSVVAAAVILDPNNPIEGLNDSKKLTEKKREKLFYEIQEKALAWAIAEASAAEIDELNILQASLLAMRRAVEALSIQPEHVLVDGNKIPQGLAMSCDAVVGGDALHAEISAASILAKVLFPEPVSPATMTTWLSRMAAAISSRRAETGNCSG